MFGDNESVVNSSMKIDAKLHKHHNALSFHRVRESIAAGVCNFFFLPGEFNPADILSKHLRPLLFWHGDTANIPSQED